MDDERVARKCVNSSNIVDKVAYAKNLQDRRKRRENDSYDD